jgi:hypothetical protein
MPRAAKKDTKAEDAPKKDDSGKIKKPMIPFFFFSQAKRSEVQEMVKNAPRGRGRPKSKAGVVPKMLGKMWNEMTPSERKPYEDQAKAAKEAYDAAIEASS